MLKHSLIMNTVYNKTKKNYIIIKYLSDIENIESNDKIVAILPSWSVHGRTEVFLMSKLKSNIFM